MIYKLTWTDDTLIDYIDEGAISSKMAEIGYTEDFSYKVGSEAIQIEAWHEIEAQNEYEAIGRAIVYLKNHNRAIDEFKIINNEITIYEQ